MRLADDLVRRGDPEVAPIKRIRMLFGKQEHLAVLKIMTTVPPRHDPPMEIGDTARRNPAPVDRDVPAIGADQVTIDCRDLLDQWHIGRKIMPVISELARFVGRPGNDIIVHVDVCRRMRYLCVAEFGLEFGLVWFLVLDFWLVAVAKR